MMVNVVQLLLWENVFTKSGFCFFNCYLRLKTYWLSFDLQDVYLMRFKVV